MNLSHLEAQFDLLWHYHYPNLKLVQEYRFYPKRRFRFDFAHVEARVGIEVHGGIYRNGRHVRIGGFNGDCIKSCLAASIDWVVYPLTDKMITEEWIHSIAATILHRAEARHALH